VSSVKIIEDLLSESGLQCQGSIVHFNPDEIKALKEAVQTMNDYEKGALEELKKFKNEIELVENRHMRQKLIHNITDRIKELKKCYERETKP